MTERNMPRLPQAAEALLSGWPVPERSDEDWDRTAATVMEAVTSNEGARPDDALLEPPLPQTEADGTLPNRGSTPHLTGPSLAEIARSKVRQVDRDRQLAVAKDSLKHVAVARHTGETAENVARAAEVAELNRYREQRQSGATDGRGAGWRGGVLGAAITLVAVAAAFVLYVSRQPVQTPATAPPPKEIARADPSTAHTEEFDEGDEPLAKLDELPVEEGEKESKRPPSAPRLTAARPRVAKAAPDTNQEESPAQSDLEPDEFDTKLEPTDSQTGLDRLAPTTGEALAAVAPATSRAKVCVAGHAKQSNATVVFGSDGRVKSVAVSGPAAGTPAEECIRNLFMSARVAPFAKPEFTVNLPVRP